MSTFTDRTLVVSGGSRGIGLAIALGAAKRGANVVLLAKTAEPHPKLPGTVHTAVAESRPRAARASPWSATCARKRTCSAPSTPRSSTSAASTSASTTPAPSRPTRPSSCRAKKFDLMMDINVRGTFLLTKACLPHLREVGEPRTC